MQTFNLSLEIPLKYSVEICIAGAGPGGIAAAVTAARRGRNVILLDAHTMAGGMSTAALVPVFMTLSDGVHFLPDGFGREIVYGLNPDGGSRIPTEKLKRLYEKLLTDAGVNVLYYSRLVAVQKEDGRICRAVFAGPGGLFAVSADCFIDGTGDGTLAVFAGASYESGDPATGDVMPSTLCSLWAGIDDDAYRKGGAFSHNDGNMTALLEQAFRSGELSVEDYHHTGVFRTTERSATGNITHVFNIDPADERSLTDGLIRNRRLLAEYERFYRKHIAGFESAEIVSSGSLLGVRESRRIKGEYTLCRADYDARRSFEDEIGRYNFPADIHPSRPGRKELEEHKKLFSGTRYGKGESYGIPYRILLPEGQRNLLLCGRCVSCDRHVFASIRVIPACYITGQAAGMAAALSVEHGCSPGAVDRSELRAELRKTGAYFTGTP